MNWLLKGLNTSSAMEAVFVDKEGFTRKSVRANGGFPFDPA